MILLRRHRIAGALMFFVADSSYSRTGVANGWAIGSQPDHPKPACEWRCVVAAEGMKLRTVQAKHIDDAVHVPLACRRGGRQVLRLACGPIDTSGRSAYRCSENIPVASANASRQSPPATKREDSGYIEEVVAEDGIEPPTRGFSIPCSTN